MLITASCDSRTKCWVIALCNCATRQVGRKPVPAISRPLFWPFVQRTRLDSSSFIEQHHQNFSENNGILGKQTYNPQRTSHVATWHLEIWKYSLKFDKFHWNSCRELVSQSRHPRNRIRHFCNLFIAMLIKLLLSAASCFFFYKFNLKCFNFEK